MARKRIRREPQVPRSTAEGIPSSTPRSSAATTESPRTMRPTVRAATPEVDFASEYGYIRRDLMQTIVIATLLFAAMFALYFGGVSF